MVLPSKLSPVQWMWRNWLPCKPYPVQGRWQAEEQKNHLWHCQPREKKKQCEIKNLSAKQFPKCRFKLWKTSTAKSLLTVRQKPRVGSVMAIASCDNSACDVKFFFIFIERGQVLSRLSRFPAKMTLVYACALLSIENISFSQSSSY